MRLAGTVLRDGGASVRVARTAIGAHGAIQRTWELASLIAIVRRLRPRTVLEIGTFRGGTLACWAQAAAPDARLLCIDRLEPAFGIVEAEAHAAQLRRLVLPGQQLTFLPLDSQLESTAAAVKHELAGATVDFLWIDGDHRDAAVRRDFALYGPLVSDRGIIAFHDIHPDPSMPDNQSHRLWGEIKRSHTVREFIDQDHRGGAGMGIGVLQVARRTDVAMR
jgi:predicted O-methyltransferase YrrM